MPRPSPKPTASDIALFLLGLLCFVSVTAYVLYVFGLILIVAAGMVG